MFTRLLSLWVTGALLLPLSCGVESDSEDDYEATTPTYDYDYENSTLDYYTYNPENSAINYDNYEVLKDSGNPRNKDSVQMYRHDVILTGLLVIVVCQQT